MKNNIALIALLIFITKTLNAQHMHSVDQTVTQLFVHTDERNWEEVKNCFATKVLLDYTSMAGGSPAELSPEEIVSNWKTILPGFEHTHHQVGNFLFSSEENTAHVFCYGTATHYLTDDGGNVWTVVGTYDFSLIREGIDWKIKEMKFNFKYQDGNMALPQKAVQNLK